MPTFNESEMFYYNRDGERVGPVSGEHLKRLVSQGTVKREELVWPEGSQQGTSAGSIVEAVPITTPPDIEKPGEPVGSRARKALKSVSTRRLFLSCVTHEFRCYRDALAANLAQPGVELRRQEDFVNTGRTTLEKLDDYIRSCDAVIHLSGYGTGAYPRPAEVQTLLGQIPDFGIKLGVLDLLQPPGLSYTQWEAWLALYHGKPLALYRASDVARRELGFIRDDAQRDRQQLHWKRMESLGRDRKEFVSPQDLSIEVLRALPLLVPEFSDNVRRGQVRDRNLLFAVLAMQDDILSHAAFVRVCKLWAEKTNLPIADVMSDEGLLTPEDRALVEARVDRKLKARQGDARQSLADCLGSDARNSLAEALDPVSFASLPHRFAGVTGLNASNGNWRYRLTRTHGVGGLGVVSVAVDSALDRSVAVKQLKPDRLLDSVAVERFIREARITGTLQHPNIVPVYELGLTPDDQIPFYAMRFVGHRTFQDAILQHYSDNQASSSDRNLRFRSLVQSFIAVCNAVSFAHEQQIIHRDIKPANIMIGDFGEVILLDWGLAKRIDEFENSLPKNVVQENDAQDCKLTQEGAKLGSPAYMAPEQASGRIDEQGPHTDIYGLGVTLYELLTGDIPFTGATTDELLNAIQTQVPSPPTSKNPNVSRAIAAICCKAMAKEATDRYASATALASDLQHWLADEKVMAYSESMVERAQRFTRKRPGLFSGIVATISVGILALSTGLYFVNKERNRTAIALKHVEEQRQEATKARDLARDSLSAATVSEKLAQKRLEESIEAKEVATKEKAVAESRLTQLATIGNIFRLEFDEMYTSSAEVRERGQWFDSLYVNLFMGYNEKATDKTTNIRGDYSRNYSTSIIMRSLARYPEAYQELKLALEKLNELRSKIERNEVPRFELSSQGRQDDLLAKVIRDEAFLNVRVSQVLSESSANGGSQTTESRETLATAAVAYAQKGFDGFLNLLTYSQPNDIERDLLSLAAASEELENSQWNKGMFDEAIAMGQKTDTAFRGVLKGRKPGRELAWLLTVSQQRLADRCRRAHRLDEAIDAYLQYSEHIEESRKYATYDSVLKKWVRPTARALYLCRIAKQRINLANGEIDGVKSDRRAVEPISSRKILEDVATFNPNESILNSKVTWIQDPKLALEAFLSLANEEADELLIQLSTVYAGCIWLNELESSNNERRGDANSTKSEIDKVLQSIGNALSDIMDTQLLDIEELQMDPDMKILEKYPAVWRPIQKQ